MSTSTCSFPVVAISSATHMLWLTSDCSSLRNEHEIGFYLRSKNNPMMANVTPTILCHDGGSRKKRIPAIAMIAAPPARIAGTDESGPPFWKRRKNATVPAPTQTPVSAEDQKPSPLNFCPHRPVK